MPPKSEDGEKNWTTGCYYDAAQDVGPAELLETQGQRPEQEELPEDIQEDADSGDFMESHEAGMSALREAETAMEAASAKLSSIKGGDSLTESETQDLTDAWSGLYKAKALYMTAEARLVVARDSLAAQVKELKQEAKKKSVAHDTSMLDAFMAELDGTISAIHDRLATIDKWLSSAQNAMS
mmetsp:Transcript_23837/g.62826  ORF Transcript_23837/g.62826 Transcript_23837/m.62826 type:complete len:182 (-) Transcript_23837:75-620(-)